MKVIARLTLERDVVRVETKDERLRIHVPTTGPMIARLNGRTQAYFHVEIEKTSEGDQVHIGEVARADQW